MIRPLRDEVERYGHYSLAAESIYDHPFQWGSKRTGPDLARVGGRYSDEWHTAHMINPKSVVPESVMPSYGFLAETPINTDGISALLRTHRFAGVPYSNHQIENAAAMSGERLSLAPQSAMDAAQASADIILLNERLDILPDVLTLSKVARLRMLQNFGLAALYNIITIPLAFSGFATPLMAALAMSLSSITVTLNAFRLPKINKGNAPDLFQPQQGKTP